MPAENQWERRDLQDSVFPGIEVERSWDFRPSYKCIICFRCSLTGVMQPTAIMPLVWNEYRCVWGEESSIICFCKKKKIFWQTETDRMNNICAFTVLKSLPSQTSGYPTVPLGAISMETLCWNIILRGWQIHLTDFLSNCFGNVFERLEMSHNGGMGTCEQPKLCLFKSLDLTQIL